MPASVRCCVALAVVAALAPGVPQAARVAHAQARGTGPVAAPADDLPLRIDAVVTDKRGRAVSGLGAADFELVEDGAARTVAAVEFRTLPRTGAPAPAIVTEADEAQAARQPGTRVFAFVLDEFHVSPGPSSDRARDMVSRFIDEQLQPQDLALVLRPLDPLNGLRFTRDRAALHAALAAFSGRKGDLAPRSRFEEQFIGSAPAAVIAARGQIVTAALRELTLRLGELQADRGVVVLLSEGLHEPGAPRAGRAQDLQGVVRASSRFHLSTYTFNPGERDADQAVDTGRERVTGTLEWLAAQTGGRAVAAGGDLAAGAAQMTRDLAAYYAITCRPSETDGKFHPVEIRTKQRTADVRARPGYWAPLGGEWRALLAAGSVAPISARPLHRSSIVETWVGLASDQAGRARMVISWEPRTPGAAPVAVVLQARTTAGAELFQGRLAPVQGGAAGQSDSARFDVPAGRVELDMSIVDVQGKVLDTELRDFDVPDLRSQRRGPMLLFPEVVRTRTLRDFRAAAADPDAAPSSLRVFARGDRLLIRVPAYDASGVAVTVSARVLNERGDTMRDIDRADNAAGDTVAQFALPLSWLVPGQYMIELAGANANGTVKERVAFRVRS
jgi:VWFA-related protein